MNIVFPVLLTIGRIRYKIRSKQTEGDEGIVYLFNLS
jgi:hypothetical protein